MRKSFRFYFKILGELKKKIVKIIAEFDLEDNYKNESLN